MEAATSIPTIGRREAATRATEEYGRLVGLLRTLEPDDWERATDCPEWTVREMVAHVAGALEAGASLRELFHQERAAGKIDRPLVDALGVVQIRDRAAVSNRELVNRLDDVITRGVRGRKRIPRPIRAVKMKVELPFGTERWRIGYLLDTIYLRDTWMHRVDITGATGRSMHLSADHDGRIVADVVGEWSRRHAQPFRLDLEGPAGGSFEAGSGGDVLRLDAVEFCRIVSGRVPGTGLLTQEVPF